jgi:FkbH-like protein
VTEPAGEPTSREPEHADEARGTLRAPDESRTIKCVVWDLDNTLWQGVVLENDDVRLSRHTLDAVKTLDGRGILQSIASKNEHDKAMAKLNELGVSEFFLYPQINWNSKAASVESIARSLNIGLDAVALIDDDPFEREEVAFSLPQVLCLDAAVLERLLDMPRMNPPFVTEDASRRRLMYLSGIERDKVEAAFVGPQEEFLASLRMILRIAPAREADLLRAEELTRRTNQLNTTGVTYSYDELNYFRQSDRHPLLLADLEDKFGGYGKIGLTLVECLPQCWTIKLLLMSCRVMSRGVGGVMISHVLQLARGRRRRAGGLRSEREKSYDVCDLQVRRLQRGATDGEGQGVGARPLTHPTLPILFQVRVRNLRAAQFRRPA